MWSTRTWSIIMAMAAAVLNDYNEDHIYVHNRLFKFLYRVSYFVS